MTDRQRGGRDGGERRAAIIDIGSNSVRLVVYAGSQRAPVPIFNEKLSVGLGADLAVTGRMPAKAYARALRGLARFRALTEAMAITDLRCVATAAVRDASNGSEFLNEARALGLDIELLSGSDEARISGLGVLSAIPDADGIVADLGGGSLELVRVHAGGTAHATSFPIGALRIGALRERHGRDFGKAIVKMIAEAGWPGEDKGLPLYLVGGSWRALARYQMTQVQDPLPVVSGHEIPVESVPRLARQLKGAEVAALAALPGISSARAPTIEDAAMLLEPLARALGASALVVSTSGLREGLLFDRLPAPVRAADPLIAATRAEGRRFARFAAHGDALEAWIAPLFADDDAAACRLRLAACLLAETGWTANPDFRAERSAEMALHGQWSGIDLADRLVLAQALWSAAGGEGEPYPRRLRLPDLGPRLERAVQWGLAIRLGERLSGGAPAAFAASRLARVDQTIELSLDPGNSAFAGEQVEKRLRQLADIFGCGWSLRCD